MHFIADLKGYWDAFPKRRNMVRVGVAILAVATIVAGFFIVGTPAQARLQRFDAQKVSDLQNIQSQVVYFWQAKQKLPAAITDLNNSLNYGPVPMDPQSGQPYSYQSTGALTFKLCAAFNAESRANQIDTTRVAVAPIMPAGVKGAIAPQDNWQHAAGQVCFDRTIDPAFYPPLTKQP